MDHQFNPAVGLGSQISILGQVSKPSSKRAENVSFAILSGDLKCGVHDPIACDPFNLNGPKLRSRTSHCFGTKPSESMTRLSQTGYPIVFDPFNLNGLPYNL